MMRGVGAIGQQLNFFVSATVSQTYMLECKFYSNNSGYFQ